MWISRADYDVLVERSFKANGAVEVLERQVAAQRTTMEFLAFRLTTAEHERAQLIHRYMGVSIAVPSIDLDVDRTPHDSKMSDIPSFQDVGDEEAKALGLDWDEQGRATQHGKVIN